MFSAISKGSTARSIPSGHGAEKKHRRDKSDSSKKRIREADQEGQTEEPRKHKKSKKHDKDQAGRAEPLPNAAVEHDEEETETSHKKHRRDKSLMNGGHHPARIDSGAEPNDGDEAHEERYARKHRKHDNAGLPPALQEQREHSQQPGEAGLKKKKKKRDKHGTTSSEGVEPIPENSKDKKTKKKKRSRSEKREGSPEPSDLEVGESAPDTMEIDSPQVTTALAAAKLPTEIGFPFYTQTMSFYVPFYPVGFDKPITNVSSQHLDPLVNHYSPLFKGVLLGYSNVNLSQRPVRADPKNPPTDRTSTTLESIDEYAVGFGWLTADLDLFIPRRGAWMEGTVNLQSEGHIGVVCWDKFNASIEAKRLPRGWRWVDLTNNGQPNKTKLSSEPEDGEESDQLDGAELEITEMHTTGYWVGGDNKRVSGALQFRIKNFEVGLAGDYGYLSIEGTMLSHDEEGALAIRERETERKRRQKVGGYGGPPKPMTRRVPEFSMTTFGKEDEEEDSGQRQELYRGSQPGTPDD